MLYAISAHVYCAALVMTAIGQSSSSSCEDDGRLRNIIRLDKIADHDVSDLDKQHVVRAGPFRGVVIRHPTSGAADRPTRFGFLKSNLIYLVRSFT